MSATWPSIVRAGIAWSGSVALVDRIPRVGPALLHMLTLVFLALCFWFHDDREERDDRRAAVLGFVAAAVFLVLLCLNAPHLAWVGAYALGGAALAAVYPPGLLDDGEGALEEEDEEPEHAEDVAIPMGPIPDPPVYGPTGLEPALGDRPSAESPRPSA